MSFNLSVNLQYKSVINHQIYDNFRTSKITKKDVFSEKKQNLIFYNFQKDRNKMMNYQKLKERLDVFEDNEEHDTLIRKSDISQLLRDAIKNSDDDNAMFLLRKYFIKEDEYNKNIETDRIFINNHFELRLFGSYINDERETESDILCDKVHDLFQISDSVIDCLTNLFEDKFVETLGFLYKEKFIENGFFTYDPNDDERNHILLKIDSRFYSFFGFNNKLFKILIEDNLNEDNMFYLEHMSDNSLIRPSKYFDNFKDIEVIKEHIKLGVLRNDFNRYTIFCITENLPNDIIELFIKHSGGRENLKSLIEDEEYSFCDKFIVNFHGKYDKFENMLRYGAYINYIYFPEKRDIIHILFSTKNHTQHRKTLILMLEYSTQENIVNNFMRLLKFLNVEDILRFYNEGVRIGDYKLDEDYQYRFTKDKLLLLNDLDDNFIDFIINNLELMKKNCDGEALRYIETLI